MHVCALRPEAFSLDRCLSDGGDGFPHSVELREQEGQGPAGCVGDCRGRQAADSHEL